MVNMILFLFFFWFFLLVYCLYVYEKNTRLTREGEDWLITRKAFLILMAFMNCYFWVLNVAKIEVVVDLTSSKMEEFFSGSIERIIYTINRASTLAYHVESVQLFYKFYIEDNATPLNDQYEDLDEHADYGFQVWNLFVYKAGPDDIQLCIKYFDD